MQITFDKKNYRKHSEQNKKRIRKSLTECGAGRSVLVDKDGCLIAGNGVFEQAEKMGIKTRIVETDGTELVVVKRTDIGTDDPKRKTLALADNATSDNVEWDIPNIVEDFDVQIAEDWGISVDLSVDDDELNGGQNEKNEQAEKLIIDAWHRYCEEFVAQLDILETQGYIMQGMTPAYAQIQFLKAKYYGAKYQRKNSLIFTPMQFKTSANSKSYYDQLIESKTKDAGIAGFRTVSNDGNLTAIFGSSYPIGVARMPLDFPVEIARDLISKYANKGRVLDPCHGWGGRLVGALLEEVEEYVGVDPSPYASEGVAKLYDTFKQYQDTKCKLIAKPYEKVADDELGGLFDFALTSPPYFDVEQYDGEETSTKLYNNFRLWVDMFYEPLICNTISRLKDGGVFALQVGSQSYDLKGEAIRICKKHGYKFDVQGKNILGTNSALHGTDEERGETIIIISK